jgi:predicted phage terminase large subunit-like protein
MLAQSSLDKIINETLITSKGLIEHFKNDNKKKRLKKKLLLDFKEFVKYFWDNAGTSNPFCDSVVIDAICAIVNAILRGELADTLISTPMREGKSTLISILLPVFLLLHKPRLSFLTASYSSVLANQFNTAMRDLINCKKFKDLFGDDLSILKENKDGVKTKQGGSRRAVGFDGAATGFGGSVLLIDDPNNLRLIQYASHREQTWSTYSRVFYTRRDNFRESILLGVMHRSHEEDLFGRIIAQGDKNLTYVVIPFLYDPETHAKVVSPFTGKIIWEDTRRQKNELTSPQRYTQSDVVRIRKTMSESDFNSLYQGNPTPKEGNIIKSKWFKKFTLSMMRNLEMVFLSVDTAMSSKLSADHSATTAWGVFKQSDQTKAVVLLNVWYDRLDFPELLDALQRQIHNIYDDSNEYEPQTSLKPHIVIIEKKASGENLIQCLRRMGNRTIVEYIPKSISARGFAHMDDAKVNRVIKITPIIESGRIYLPVDSAGQYTKFSEKFISACTSFPNSSKASRDIIDTFSQAIDFMEQRGILINKFEEERTMQNFRHLLLPEVPLTNRKMPLNEKTHW